MEFKDRIRSVVYAYANSHDALNAAFDQGTIVFCADTVANRIHLSGEDSPFDTVTVSQSGLPVFCNIDEYGTKWGVELVEAA